MTSSDSWIASPEAERFDIALAEFDCLATQAHVLMLRKQGVIAPEVAARVLLALGEIEDICKAGEFRYEPGYGAQLTLEKMIVDRVGPEAGYQVHTGRSRNDQVLTAQKLYVKQRVLEVFAGLGQIIEKLIDNADSGVLTIMPGYTHMQPARPTTVGQWCAAYAEMFIRDFQRLQSVYLRNDSCPLGAAESHGTSWSLDRDYTRQLLGFRELDEIPLDAVSSRGESDADFLTALSFVSLHLSKFAQDLLLFSTFEYGYVALGSPQASRMGKLTGSSIMPQKRNPDVLELLRGQASQTYSFMLHAFDVLRGLPTGYNRDSRETKAPIIQGLEGVIGSLDQAVQIVDNWEFDEAAMLQAVEGNYSLATDLAEYLAQEYEIPFRQMHGIVGRTVSRAIDEGRRLSEITPAEIVEEAREEGFEFTVSQEDLDRGADPQAAVERRANVGGSSEARMRSWIDRKREAKVDLSDWLEGELGRIEASRERIRTLASD